MRYSAILMGICLLATLAGCTKPKSNDPNGSSSNSRAYQSIIKRVDAMAQQPWDKKDYETIAADIQQLKTSSERSSASSYLDAQYSVLMVNEATALYNGGCKDGKSTHDKINAIFKELKAKGFDKNNIPGLAELNTLQAVHTKASNIGVGYQSVNGYANQKYDLAYETNKKREAQNLLADSNLKCKNLREKVQRLTTDAAYTGRRQKFCQNIVDNYIAQCTDPADREKNHAISSLSTSGLSDVSAYIQQIKARQQVLKELEDSKSGKPQN